MSLNVKNITAYSVVQGKRDVKMDTVDEVRKYKRTRGTGYSYMIAGKDSKGGPLFRITSEANAKKVAAVYKKKIVLKKAKAKAGKREVLQKSKGGKSKKTGTALIGGKRRILYLDADKKQIYYNTRGTSGKISRKIYRNLNKKVSKAEFEAVYGSKITQAEFNKLYKK